MKLITAILSGTMTCVLLTHAATGAEAAMTPETVKPLVKAFALKERPGLDPTTAFKITEYKIEGLQEALQAQLFHARYTSPEGKQFDHRVLIYRDGKLRPFTWTFGSSGLMSAVVKDHALYYTYSWGSGIARSHVGRISIDGGSIKIVESGGYSDRDLFVKNGEDGVLVEEGAPNEFNSWKAARSFGRVKVRETSLAIIGGKGTELSPRFSVFVQENQETRIERDEK